MNEPRTEMAISPEVEAEMRRLCSSAMLSGHAAIRAAAFDALSRHIPALLDQIAADRVLIEEAERVLEPFAEIANSLERQDEDNSVQVSWKHRHHTEVCELTPKPFNIARALLAKLRTASQRPLLTPLPEDEASALRDFGPSPDTLRPGENNSLDTHQDKPFGAGGQESGR